jgi:hypothetical protein
MRMLIAIVLMLSSLGLAFAASEPPKLSKPLTEEYLRTLNDAQLRLLRRTIQGCKAMRTPATKQIRDERDPCVISGTDRAVADEMDPDLEAFHKALPDTDRYDENRSATVWMAWVEGPKPE